jgi:hypothetical protein
MGKETFEVATDRHARGCRGRPARARRRPQAGRGELESPKRTLRLTPAADLKLELTVKDQDNKGKIVLEIGWKRRATAKAADLRVEIGHRAPP